MPIFHTIIVDHRSIDRDAPGRDHSDAGMAVTEAKKTALGLIDDQLGVVSDSASVKIFVEDDSERRVATVSLTAVIER